jgi:tetratricopeptide (TPR) repeat protein
MESNVAQLPLGHKALAWFDANKRPVLWAAGICLIVGVVVWFLLWQRGQKELAANNALSGITLAQMTGTARQESPEAYLKVAADFPNSSAGARALLLAAGNLFTNGKFPESQALFERFTREYHGSPLLSEGLIGIAAALEAQAKNDQAVSAYKDLIARHPGESVIPQAKFSLARLYEAQNKPEMARDLYQDVERTSAFTTLGNEAGMRMEELMAKYPNLKPQPPPAAAKPGPVTLQPVPATATNAPVGTLPTNASAPSPKK